MTGNRLCLLALVLALTAVLVAPAICSQSSDVPSRCDTLFGYWTPFGAWTQGLALVAVVLLVVGLVRRRTRR